MMIHTRVMHHTKDKGDIAVAKAIADLTYKGFVVLAPLFCEHLPFDLVGYREGKLLRFQVKYSTEGKIRNKTSWADKNGTHTREYDEDSFDYYALYLPQQDVVCYPSIKFRGNTIKSEPPKIRRNVYWFEDFLDLTDEASTRSFEALPQGRRKGRGPRHNRRKVVWPSKEELEYLVRTKPVREIATDYGVSDKAVSKWAKSYGIKPLGRGYWSKKRPA